MPAIDQSTPTDLAPLIDDLRDARHEIADEMMRRGGIDHLLLGTPDNIRYVCDYRSLIIAEGSDWMLAVCERGAQTDIYGAHVRDSVIAPSAELPRVRSIRALPAWSPVMSEPTTTVDIIAGALAGAHRVGYDAVHPELVAGLRSRLTSHDFVYVGHELFERRQRKLPSELQLMRMAWQANSIALQAAWDGAAVGATDYDLLAASLAAQQRQGAEAITHYTCNVRADQGVWFPTGKTVEHGDTVFIDQVFYGPGGYASDLTRTKFIGDPPARVARAYSDFVAVAGEVQAAARPGVSIAKLDELLNIGLIKCGLAPSPYGLGHGIGLRVCEPPSLGPVHLLDHDHSLVQGQTIAMEPETSVLHNGRTYALKIEDVFYVAAEGLEPLGTLPEPDDFVLAL